MSASSVGALYPNATWTTTNSLERAPTPAKSAEPVNVHPAPAAAPMEAKSDSTRPGQRLDRTV